MVIKVFSIYDTKACLYGPPFLCSTVGSAVRDFSDLVNDKNTRLAKHPSDFILVELGFFDDNTGSLNSLSAPKHYGMGSDYLQTPAQAMSVTDLKDLPGQVKMPFVLNSPEHIAAEDGKVEVKQ